MRKTSLIFALVGSLLMSACSFKDSPIVAKNKDLNNKLKILINDDINYTALPKGNEDELIREFLTNSPAFAQQNRQSAVRENITKLPNTMPLFRQPLFAQMVIFPFVSDDGLYHSYSESWLKIKDGEFVLSDPRSGEEAKEKIFDFNVINGE